MSHSQIIRNIILLRTSAPFRIKAFLLVVPLDTTDLSLFVYVLLCLSCPLDYKSRSYTNSDEINATSHEFSLNFLKFQMVICEIISE